MPNSPYSILVVDDSRDYRNLILHYLNELPCKATIASDGEDAVEAFSQGNFDLVLMDIIMPLMDGVDATAAIRKIEAEKGTPPTPILALSMEESMETATDCINAGASRMILKPVAKQELVSVISEMLEFDSNKT